MDMEYRQRLKKETIQFSSEKLILKKEMVFYAYQVTCKLNMVNS